MNPTAEPGADHRTCTRCVMDTSAMGITFDDKGVCNFCNEFEDRYIRTRGSSLKREGLEEFVNRVKSDGAGKAYDCIVGVSGGADSSYALHLAKKHGLRPLAVHMDNGWNSELAVHNISNLVSRLGVDLHTHVIEWQEYRSLMQACFESDVIDVELLYDNAMLAVNYQAARKFGVKWILAGTNVATEGMRIPANWLWFKRDKKNILAIARRHGVKIKTFPLFGTADFIANEFGRRIKWVSFLDFFDYNKAKCIEELQAEYGYKPYPFKHYESVFTRFYQGYLLPRKFGVDKRKVHLSTLIMSGQMSREEASTILKQSPYPTERQLQDDVEFFLKKLGWTKTQLDIYVSRPERSHAEFGSEQGLWDFCQRT